MNNNINSDEISERFRKYIIRLVFPDKILFVLWGTDLNNQDFDYLLTDNNGNIIAFKEIQGLLGYLRVDDIKYDPVNTKLWAKGYNLNKAYTSYNLTSIIKIINNQSFELLHVKEAEALELINFYNLFSDYARQIGNDEMIPIIEQKDTQLFFDFAYSSFSKYGKKKKEYINSEMGSFNCKLFTSNYKKMLKIFEHKIKLIDFGRVPKIT